MSDIGGLSRKRKWRYVVEEDIQGNGIYLDHHEILRQNRFHVCRNIPMLNYSLNFNKFLTNHENRNQTRDWVLLCFFAMAGVSDAVDWDEAMEQCGDDEEFLRELLSDLRDEINEQMIKMEEILRVSAVMFSQINELVARLRKHVKRTFASAQVFIYSNKIIVWILVEQCQILSHFGSVTHIWHFLLYTNSR